MQKKTLDVIQIVHLKSTRNIYKYTFINEKWANEVLKWKYTTRKLILSLIPT